MKRFKQMLIGLGLATLGIISIRVLDGDATVALLFVPLGLYTAITKNKMDNYEAD